MRDDAPSDAPLDRSIARTEFAAAQARLAGMPLDDLRTPLPLTYAPPGATADGASAPGPAPELRRADGPIAAALADLDRGSRSVKHLVDEALDAIARRDGELGAIVDLRADEALAAADALDAELRDGHPRRPLHGIPITVKDVIDVAGFATRGGSEAYDDLPAVDAVGVARLRAAGAIVIAKTSTHEFALGVTNPQSRNPHDPTRIPGGSSGGSTIAVATGMGLASLGTDTRASIRVPAALSGTVGFKPTYGRVPTAGVVSLSWTMDHVAPMATTVADAARVLDVLLGGGTALAASVARPTDLAASGGRPRWRIGVPAAGFDGAQPEVADRVRGAIDALAALGAELVEVRRPTATDFDDANALGLLISRAEAATFHRGLGTDLARCWAEIREQLTAAADLPALDYLAAQRVRAQLAAGLLDVFDDPVDGVDVLALPTCPVTAPPVDDFADFLMALSRNAIPWSLVGFPAISVPCGFDAAGLPVGLQLVARPDAEARLVAVGSAYEVATT